MVLCVCLRMIFLRTSDNFVVCLILKLYFGSLSSFLTSEELYLELRDRVLVVFLLLELWAFIRL